MKSRETTTEKRHAIFARNERTLGASLREHFSDIEGEMDEFREFIAAVENISDKADTLCWRFNGIAFKDVQGSNLSSLASRKASERSSAAVARRYV